MFNSPTVSQLMDRFRSSMPWQQQAQRPMGGMSMPSAMPQSPMMMPWSAGMFSPMGLGPRPTPTYSMPAQIPGAAAGQMGAAGGAGQAPPMPSGYAALYSMLGVPNGQGLWQQHWQGEQDAAAAQKRAASGDPSYVLPPYLGG